MKPIVLAKVTSENRVEWLQVRRKGIGGSDAAAIAGLNPYKSPVAVYYDKTGQIEQPDLYKVNERGGFVEGNEAAYWGNRDEAEVAKEFYLRTGKKVRKRNAVLQHPEHKFMLANIDREIVGEDAGLECKITGEFNKNEWQKGETIPQQYYLQCQHYMAVTGRQKWYIAVKIGGNKFHWDVIERDEEIIESLVQLEKEFWEKVENLEPPEMDGSDSAKDVLNMLYPAENVEWEAVDLGEDADQLIKELEETKSQLKELEAQKKEAENKLKAMLGTNEAGETSEYIVTWKPVLQKRLDTKRLKEEHPEIYEEYTKENGYRKFGLKKKKKKRAVS